MPYNIHHHSHRLAAWAASSSASASPVCRFKVCKGITILENCGFSPALASPDQLPDVNEIDETHHQWRNNVIEEAGNANLVFSHGIAAKLINCYLKVRFVCGGHHDHDRVKCLHPPIDEILLRGLADSNYGNQAQGWRDFQKARWSKYDNDTYERVIALIKQTLNPGAPLWSIEEYWAGHQ